MTARRSLRRGGLRLLLRFEGLRPEPETVQGYAEIFVSLRSVFAKGYGGTDEMDEMDEVDLMDAMDGMDIEK